MPETMDLPEEYKQNYEDFESQFAVHAVEHLEAYQNLLTAIPPSRMKLTKIDDEIYADFTSTFPELSTPEALTQLNENDMKSKEGKAKWRPFCLSYESKVSEYNQGTMLRPNAKEEYSETNNMLCLRIQFYAIEIARNRLGVNDDFYNKHKKA